VPSTAQEEGSGHAGNAAAEHEHLHEGGRYPCHSDGATGPALPLQGGAAFESDTVKGPHWGSCSRLRARRNDTGRHQTT